MAKINLKNGINMYCIIISGSCAVLLPCARLYPLSAAAQLVLCHPADGEPHDHAVLGNTSPRVSITARFKREVEILGARPLSMHHPGNSVLACGTFHDRACACLRVLWCVLRKEEEGREVEMLGCAGFIKQTVDSPRVPFLIHLCLHP